MNAMSEGIAVCSYYLGEEVDVEQVNEAMKVYGIDARTLENKIVPDSKKITKEANIVIGKTKELIETEKLS